MDNNQDKGRRRVSARGVVTYENSTDTGLTKDGATLARITALEKKLAMYERAISVDAGRIIFQMPTITRGAANINGITIFTGQDTPEGVVTANVGSMFLRLNGGSGSTLYVKESGTGNTGWSTTA
jgi:hypothetical protein